jgi:hypothetical protein
MTAAVIAASTSIVVAVLVFVLNQLGQVRLERRRARLDRISGQLRDLYGPLRALVDVNEDLWARLHGSFLPDREQRRPPGDLTDAELTRWQVWMRQVLMPTNRQMRDLIVEHADLIVEPELPKPLRDFCSHVAACEVALSTDDLAVARAALVDHPGEPYVDYVRGSFTRLKAAQVDLLRLNR